MGSAIPAGYVEVSKGVYERSDIIKKRSVGRKTVLPTKGKSRNSESKSPVQHGAVGKAGGKKTHTGRVLVRITIFRKRLVDPCNAGQKYLVDCLRYVGLLVDDREQDIALEIRQEKTREEEETLIELFRDTEPIRC
ncbi:MAG: hypothetical protein EBR82_85355 [Caulobacteraceae bacterium]|nr:hypothetical protein [Caulobacteraceae bacterium]